MHRLDTRYLPTLMLGAVWLALAPMAANEAVVVGQLGGMGGFAMVGQIGGGGDQQRAVGGAGVAGRVRAHNGRADQQPDAQFVRHIPQT